MTFSRLPLIACFLLIAAVVFSAEPEAVTIAREKQALLPLIIAADAPSSIKKTAEELAKYLERISDAAFTVQNGDGSSGIVLGRPADFSKLPFAVQFGTGPFEREEYVLRSHAKGLYLLGATELAVSHAAWDLLYRLGYRQFFPGETWEVIPQMSELRVPVLEGQDGKLWKFENNHGQRLLMTVPPFLARSAEELLLPVEIIEAEGTVFHHKDTKALRH